MRLRFNLKDLPSQGRLAPGSTSEMMPSTETKHLWRSMVSFEAEERQGLDASIMAFVSAHPLANLDHDLGWLTSKVDGGDRSFVAYVLLDPTGVLAGYAPFFVHPSSFAFEYAARTIYSVGTRRHAITAQPLLREGLDEEACLKSLLAFLRENLRGPDVLFGLGVPSDSGFARVLHSPEVQAQFLLMPHGPQYARRLLHLPDNLDAYLALLGPKSRADLRRHERKLTKAAQDDVRVTVHASEAAMAEFVSNAAQVSKLTYQRRLHGLGINDGAGTVQRFVTMARQGVLRCYLLYAQGVPIAFMVGYLYRGTYYSETIGYDPNWAEHSVGNVLHMHVVRDLTALEPKVQWFDFMYGDNSNKERLSTHAHLERNFYLVPKTPRWILLVGMLRGFDALTDRINSLLERFGVKEKLKRWLRRRATGLTKSK